MQQWEGIEGNETKVFQRYIEKRLVHCGWEDREQIKRVRFRTVLPHTAPLGHVIINYKFV